MSHGYISSRTHGILDYVFGVVVFVLPWILGFERGTPEMWTCLICGLAVVAYSKLTNYEVGVARWLSFDTHLLLDRLVGVILLASPWLFGFAGRVWLPFVILGAIALIVPSLTSTAHAEAEAVRTEEPRTGRATYTRVHEEVLDEESSYDQFIHRKEAERES